MLVDVEHAILRKDIEERVLREEQRGNDARSMMGMLSASAHQLVNSKPFDVFLPYLPLPFFSSMCNQRVVLEQYLVCVPLLMTKICTYSNRPHPLQKLSR